MQSLGIESHFHYLHITCTADSSLLFKDLHIKNYQVQISIIHYLGLISRATIINKKMKIIPLMYITLGMLLTSFLAPTPTHGFWFDSNCGEILNLCVQTIANKKQDKEHSRCCELIAPNPCMCGYLKNPPQKESAFRLMRTCGKSNPRYEPLEKYYKCR